MGSPSYPNTMTPKDPTSNDPSSLDMDVQMELYMQNREHGRMILESVENGPLVWSTVEENGVTRTKKYAELSAAEKSKLIVI
ncbi:hypothetical protein Tco_1236924 [Tanacetum coccineum]